MVREISMENITGFQIGHAENQEAKTGCTVILCEDGAVAGYDLRGSAPGTRETDLLRPGFLVDKVHAILLTGGSAFGLAAAAGVQRFLEKRGKGYDARGVRVPIVPGAVIFDLHVGDSRVRPDAEMGYRACQNARSDGVPCGKIGVGTGATIGKILGMDYCMEGGVGYAAEKLDSGLIVSALVVVNALGDVVDPNSGQIIAGARNPNGAGFLNSANFLRGMKFTPPLIRENTTLGVVMTNARLDKVQINKVAQMAQNGLARAVRPVHTMYDGDLIFALSAGDVQTDVNLVGTMAADCVARAIVEAAKISNERGIRESSRKEKAK